MSAREKLAAVSDQVGVQSLVALLVGKEVVRRDGLSFVLAGESVSVRRSHVWTNDFRLVWRLAEALRGGVAVEPIELLEALDVAWALIEKALEVKYPCSSRTLAHYNGGDVVHVWWMVPIPPGERDTNLMSSGGFPQHKQRR